MQAVEGYAIGLDFGSNAVRCVVIDCATGHEAGVGVWGYRCGDKGVFGSASNPHVARQDPKDFVDGLCAVVPMALLDAVEKNPSFSIDSVIGVGIDTTGSTPMPVDENLKPLAFREEFRDNLNAKAWMWKDHSSVSEAELITRKAKEIRPEYLSICGGTYSSEWYFSKVFHCLNVDPQVFDAAYIWLEMADYLPALLCGIDCVDDMKFSVCAAGHKAMFNESWGGFPDSSFWESIDPRLGEYRDRLPSRAYSSDHRAGELCVEWSRKLGLPAGIPVAVGAFDAHLGAVGAGVGAGRMVKIIGTSVCDVLVGADVDQIPGVCGIVDGSIVPGMKGIEAGQSAVGDIFNWFIEKVCGGDASTFAQLEEQAAKLKPGQSGLMALDWQNGNRSILADARLTGLIVGLTLQTTQAEIYRCLLEATAFGARRILDRLEEYGVDVREVVACGGIAEKNPLFMQIYADVLGRTMMISASSQTCALGAAIMAMVAAGIYPDVPAAQKRVCSFKEEVYRPVSSAKVVYDQLYKVYCELHDSFGFGNHASVMKELLKIRQ
ncbi:MAG: ribulokinase [Lentisphaerae bacterium]|jgi:L-ribulokinase|nr:ribulokinase [Lentisphaerota bacterium]